MKISNWFYALGIVLCFSSCSGCFQQNTSEDGNSAQDTTLEDIVETPPERKINQAPEPETKPATEVAKTTVGRGTTIGTFLTLEEGDYYYLHIKDEKGNEDSYMLWRAYEGAADLNVDNWKSSVRKKVKIDWQEGMEDIPESGEKMLVKKVLAVEILE